MKFTEGEKVKINPDPKIGEGTVVNPCDPTDMMCFRGFQLEPVGHYVRVHVDGKVYGYHECSLDVIHYISCPSPAERLFLTQ